MLTSTVKPGFAQAVDLFPEIAPRLRIDTRRRLVEQQQPRLVQHAGGERHALLPAARELARELVLPRDKSQPLERFVHLRLGVGNLDTCARRIRDSRGSRDLPKS